MNAMRGMMAEFMRDTGRSESGGATKNAVLGESSRGTVPAAVGNTTSAFGECIGQSEFQQRQG